MSDEELELDAIAAEVTIGAASSGDDHTYPTDKEAPITLVKKANSNSIIWNYFGFHADKFGNPIDNGKPRCRICYHESQCKFGNTTNLFKHLQDKHYKLYLESKVCINLKY